MALSGDGAMTGAGFKYWHGLCNTWSVDAHSPPLCLRKLHKTENDAEPTCGAYGPNHAVFDQHAADTSLSEAPISCLKI